MFICAKCKNVSKSGEPAKFVVTKKRERQYNNPEAKEAKITVGWEIAEEAKMCSGCTKRCS